LVAQLATAFDLEIKDLANWRYSLDVGYPSSSIVVQPQTQLATTGGWLRPGQLKYYL